MKIAVAGAGIGGLAAASLLARAGHTVEVIDRFVEPAPVGAGLMLQETGLAVLAAMGLRERAEARGSRITRLIGQRAGDGRTVLKVRFEALRRGLCAVGVQRAALFDLLYQSALEAGAQFSGGCEVTGCDPVSGTVVLAGGRELAGFDLVIDALGARSPLSEPPRSELPFGALWATVDWPGEAFQSDALEQRYRAARQMAGIMPSGMASDGAPLSATYFWSLDARTHEAWREGDFDAWREEAAALWPETAPLLSGLRRETLAFARYRHRTLSRPWQGRLAHVGDSWHATSPQLGQGANSALLDAFALAKGLEAAPQDLGGALRTYTKLRAFHVRLYQAMSHVFTPVYQSRGALLPAFRDWIAAPLMGVPPAPPLLAALVSGAYGSPLKRLGLRPGAV